MASDPDGIVYERLPHRSTARRSQPPYLLKSSRIQVESLFC